MTTPSRTYLPTVPGATTHRPNEQGTWRLVVCALGIVFGDIGTGPGGIGGVSGMTLLAVIGAALVYGDGVITPAISVLSAVEGLAIASPALASWVVPITCLILVGLFAIQKQGAGRVGRLFGPVMLVWFLTLAAVGRRCCGAIQPGSARSRRNGLGSSRRSWLVCLARPFFWPRTATTCPPF
jgi:hypothetical protein